MSSGDRPWDKHSGGRSLFDERLPEPPGKDGGRSGRKGACYRPILMPAATTGNFGVTLWALRAAPLEGWREAVAGAALGSR